MDETQTLRAEVEGLKLILGALIRTLPESVRAVWQENAAQQIGLFEGTALYWTYTDQQRAHAQLLAATLLGLPPADEPSRRP